MLKSRPTIIYLCCDPKTHEVKYVGKTVNNLDYRITSHRLDKTETYRGRWFRKVKNPEYFSVEIVDSENDWEEAEKFWIAYMKFLGANLVNKTAGGSSFFGYKRTEEHTKKIVAANTGKKRSLKIRKKISKANMGRIVSEETRLKKSIIGKGRVHTEESKLKMSDSMKGLVKSKEHRRKISETLSGRKTKPCSEETKVKISAANRLRWEEKRA